MLRYLKLLKYALLIIGNLALIALFVGVPVYALVQGGWVAAAIFLAVGFGVFLLKHPAFLFGMWLSK